MAWIYYESRESVEGGVGPVAGVSAAWMPPSPMDGFGVSRNRTRPHPSECTLLLLLLPARRPSAGLHALPINTLLTND